MNHPSAQVAPFELPPARRATIYASEFAAHIGVSTRTVQRWVRAGAIPSIKVGGVTRLYREDAERIAREGFDLTAVRSASER